jgi:hypothetical protein
MKRRMFVIAASELVMAIVGMAAGVPAIWRASAATPGKTAAEEFKNIQVLKSIPADELIPTMQFISASLGVECEFCHDERDKDKDDKKTKKTAREMIRMVMAINQSNFSGQREVTCNTCHRGAIRPEAIPAIQTEGRKPVTSEGNGDDEAARASWPSGNAVLAKYLDAVGGKAALDKVTTRVEKGNAILGSGRGLPIEIYEKAPDLRVSVMHMPNGESVTGYNGKDGWLAVPGRPAREMSESDDYAAKLDATAMFPSYLAAMLGELKLQPHTEKVGDHAATVVWGTSKGQPPVKLYFDPQSGLLLRMVHYTDTALGLNPVQVDYADYRDADGVKTPYRWTIARPNGAFTIQLDDVQDNATIDAARFERPTPTTIVPEPSSDH